MLTEFIHGLKENFRYDSETARNHFELNDDVAGADDRDRLIEELKREVNERSLPDGLSEAIEINED
jgi:hypothetical protein